MHAFSATESEKDLIRGTNIVGIDPGTDEIIHAVDKMVEVLTSNDGKVKMKQIK